MTRGQVWTATDCRGWSIRNEYSAFYVHWRFLRRWIIGTGHANTCKS